MLHGVAVRRILAVRRSLFARFTVGVMVSARFFEPLPIVGGGMIAILAGVFD